MRSLELNTSSGFTGCEWPPDNRAARSEFRALMSCLSWVCWGNLDICEHLIWLFFFFLLQGWLSKIWTISCFISFVFSLWTGRSTRHFSEILSSVSKYYFQQTNCERSFTITHFIILFPLFCNTFLCLLLPLSFMHPLSPEQAAWISLSLKIFCLQIPLPTGTFLCEISAYHGILALTRSTSNLTN